MAKIEDFVTLLCLLYYVDKTMAVYLTCVMFILTRVHCDPAADHITRQIYYITTLPLVFDGFQNEAFERIPRKAHQISASNLNKFSIKCTAKTFYVAICDVNDYKHNLYLTIDYLKYDFITNKSLLFKESTVKLISSLIL